MQGVWRLFSTTLLLACTSHGRGVNSLQYATDSLCPEQPQCNSGTTTLPYIADCSKFIYCGPDGTQSLLDCPTLTHYSRVENRCVYIGLAECPQCSDEASLVTASWAATTPHCPVQLHCTPETPYGDLLPFVADCTKYIYCQGEVEKISGCPVPNHFSPKVNTCMSPERAGCPKCYDVSSTEPTDPTTPVCPPQPICTTETEFSTLPYIADCTKYIYCLAGGEEKLMDCPSSLHYNQAIGTCTDPESAQCPQCAEITSTTSVTMESTTFLPCPIQPHCTSELATTTMPYVSDCTKYIYCLPDGSEKIYNCPVSLHYSPTQNICMDPVLANCPLCQSVTSSPTPETTTETPNCEQPQCTNMFTLLPYRPDCNKYYYCNENLQEELRACPVSQHFSPIENLCMAPEYAKCPTCP